MSSMIEIPYTGGCDPAQRLDLYFPSLQERPRSPALPVVIWVHGGAWRHRSRRDEGPRLATFFADAGYLFASIDHRYAPNPADLLCKDAQRHPCQIDDVAAAIGWIYAHVASYGGDPNRLLLIGHSSGAHLVTLAAVHRTYLRRAAVPAVAIRGVASLDVRAYDIPALLAEASPEVQLMYHNAFGLDPGDWRDASPGLQLGQGQHLPPMLVVVRGDPQSRRIKREFAASLLRAGAAVTILEVPSLSHAQVRERLGAGTESEMSRAVLDFFAEVSGP